MTRRLWQAIGGTLFEEFVALAPGPGRGTRRLDGLVLSSERTRIAERGEVPDLADRDVVVIQTKASRLGMNVLGQARYSLGGTAATRRTATNPYHCALHWRRQSTSSTGRAIQGSKSPWSKQRRRAALRWLTHHETPS